MRLHITLSVNTIMILFTLFMLYLFVMCKATSCSWSKTTWNAGNYDADFQAHVPAFMAKHGCKALVTYQSNVHLKGYKRHTLQAVCPKGLKAISGGCATNNACTLVGLIESYVGNNVKEYTCTCNGAKAGTQSALFAQVTCCP